jgi:hypothetical protein
MILPTNDFAFSLPARWLSGRKTTPGTGLGLALTARIINVHVGNACRRIERAGLGDPRLQ